MEIADFQEPLVLDDMVYEIVEDKLADMILEDKISDGNKITFDIKNNEISVKIV